MKALIKRILHRLLGIERFLFWFARYKIGTLSMDKKEKGLYLFLKQVADKKGVLLDVGANIGVTAAILATKSRKLVYAYEPVPLNLRILKRVLKHYQLESRVQLVETALGNYTGTCDMVMPVVNQVPMHGLSHVIHPDITEFNSGNNTASIPIDKLDNLVTGVMVAGIKLDVENFEFEVLKGASSLIQQQRPVIYTELWDNENRRRCFELLRQWGYTSYFTKNNRLVPFEKNECQGQTFLFTHSTSQAL